MNIEQLNLQLFEAVKSGNVGDVQELIDAGAKVDVRDKDGNTPLHIAVYGDNIEIIEILIKANKDVVNITNQRW